jgi:hypothetical protein
LEAYFKYRDQKEQLKERDEEEETPTSEKLSENDSPLLN